MIKPLVQLDQSPYAHAKAQWVEPFEYQAQSSGKLVRTEVAWALSSVYGLKAAQTHVLCDAIEQMNLSSLIHDDLLDGDRIRRGIPSVWALYGPSVALVSGMYGYLDGLEKLGRLNNLDVVLAGIDSLVSLHIGQYLDAKFSDGTVLPTLEEYGFIARCNTGCFFVFILEACQCLNSLDTSVYQELKAMLLDLGVYYRYVNDYCDVNHVPHFEKKGFATDLEGGPKSFLMILADEPLVKGPRSSDQKNQIIGVLGRRGIFDEALVLMEQTYGQIVQRLNAIRLSDPSLNVKALERFLREIHFQPAPDDNYYNRMQA